MAGTADGETDIEELSLLREGLIFEIEILQHYYYYYYYFYCLEIRRASDMT
jgi:hypothetical protein